MMENSIQIFNNDEFGNLHIIMEETDPWFIGREIATSLGYKNPKAAVRELVDKDDKYVKCKSEFKGCDLHPLEIPNRGLTCINESGLYSLILSSKLPSAKRFKRWVTAEVLPELRKTGNYQIPQNNVVSVDISLVTSKLAELEEKLNSFGTMIPQMEQPKPQFSESAAYAWSKTIASEGISQVSELCDGSTPDALRMIYDGMKKLGFCESAAHLAFTDKYGIDASTLKIVADQPLYQHLFMKSVNNLLMNKVKEVAEVTEQIPETKVSQFTVADGFDDIISSLGKLLNDNHPYHVPTLRIVYDKMNSTRGWKVMLTREHCGNKRKLIEKNLNQKKKFVEACNTLLESISK